MDIYQLLDELEAMGKEGERHWATRVLLFGRVVLDADDFYEILAEVRGAMPQEVTTASQIASERDQIIEEAHRERQKILDGAREQAQLMVSNDALVLEAQARAKEIVKQSRIEGDGIRAEAEQWARGIVERLENYMGRISATVDKTKKALAAQPQPTGRGGAPPQ
jgi:hypothetical protein